MRPIKFRLRIGDKIVGYEKWFFGSPQKEELNLLNPSDKVIATVFIKNSNGVWLYSLDNKRWADKFIPHTYKDQFINKYDKKRKEIYEKDIVKYKMSLITAGVPVKPRPMIKEVKCYDLAFTDPLSNLNGTEEKTLEVIGTTFQNSELLKKEKKNCTEKEA